MMLSSASTRFCLYGAFALFLTSSATATVYVRSNASFPEDISAACSSALTADLACSSSITKLRGGLYYPETLLDDLCTSGCSAALATYESDVTTACGDETYDSLDDGYLPMYSIPQVLRYYYDYFCLSDASSGDFCNVLLAESLGIQANQSNLDSIEGGGSLNCTDCDLKQLQFLAGAAYFNDEDIVSEYSSLTSGCSATGYPLTTTTLGYNGTKTSTYLVSASATPTCTGTSYTIQPGDTCESISRSQGVATIRMLVDNGLPAYCADFPTTGSLCIEHTCTTYTVQSNDTCTSIATAHGLYYAQVLSWNPQFDLTCSNINKTVGLEICISSPGPVYTPPASASASASVTGTATTAVAVPTNAANGSTTNCASWYEAVAGDYCNLIILRYGLSLADFLVLNPEVNSNCTNLYAEESYCVAPVGDISNYPGAPGHVSVVASITTTAASLLPTATYIPAQYVPPTTIYANGTRTDCTTYINGSDFSSDLTNTTYVSQCDLAITVLDITFDDLTDWNPSLVDSTLSNCTFEAGISYCAKWSDDAPTTTYAATPAALSTATVSVQNCTQWTFADNVSCNDLLQVWNISLAYFVTLNPSVGNNCSGLQQNTYYCVNTTDIVAVTSIPPVSATSTVITAPGPTMSGIPSNCNEYYLVQTGDSCSSVEASYGITDAEFHNWNPAVSSDCGTNFWVGEAYCVGVAASGVMTTTSATTTASSTSATSVTPPGPTMTGIPSNCNNYYLVQTGDSCSSVETEFGITDAEFHAWNPAVSSDCATNFWVGEAYCVGVTTTSTATTTTTATSSRTTSTATTVTPPAPTQTGIAANCDKYYVAAAGDSCSSVEATYDITDAEFHAWNPAVSEDCTSNFWSGEAYCVGVSS